MQILIIDNNIERDSWGASELCGMARLSEGATLHVRRAPHEDLPQFTRAFDRIIISGSKTSALEDAPWISKLEDFVRSAVAEAVPLLGICYGHQLIARALGGKRTVRKAPIGEFGWAKMELLANAKNSLLMRNVPSIFHSFAWHQEEVNELPNDFVALASSKDCAVQAFELKDRAVFGIQFHPERALEAAEKSLARRRKEDPQSELLNPTLGKNIFNPELGETLFRNFLETSWK